MKNTVMFVLLVCGVFGDTGEVKTVMEGDSVTLHTNVTDTQTDYVIALLWRFGDKGATIAQLAENKTSYPNFTEGRFTDRLQISDSKSGSLTVRNMRIKHAGQYQAEINSRTEGTTRKHFNVNVYEAPRVIDAGTDEAKTVSVTEGDSVTLHTDVQTQRDDLLLWRFGDKGVLIAKGDKENNKSPLYDDDDGRFRDRLQLDDQTGSLTITNSRTSDSGVYKLKISSNKQILYKTFSVIVRGAGVSSGAVAGICIFFLLVIAGVIAAGVIFHRHRISELKHVKMVNEGHSVTLTTGVSDIQSEEVIEWRFGDKETLIAQINRKDVILSDDVLDGRFRHRLKLDDQTGDLTITNTRAEHSGLYKMKIITRRGTSSYSLFSVIVTDKEKTVMLGGSVTLNTDITDTQRAEVIQWMFGDKEIIAEINRKNNSISTNDGADGRFRDRLQLDDQTGSLTITKLETRHSGFYKLKIITYRRTSQSLFNVIVTEKLRATRLGSSVTLNSGVNEIQSDDVVLWRFGAEDTRIAQFIGGTDRPSLYNYTDGRFKHKLQLNCKTGDLTINDITAKHSGVYQVQICGNKETKCRKYYVVVYVMVMRGASVTLQTGGEIQRGDQIQWISKDKVTLVTGENGDNSKTKYTDDERFRDRVKMNHQTGDLTIRDTRQTDGGEYTLKIISDGRISYCKVIVYLYGKAPGNDVNKQKAAGNGGNESATVELPSLKPHTKH